MAKKYDRYEFKLSPDEGARFRRSIQKLYADNMHNWFREKVHQLNIVSGEADLTAEQEAQEQTLADLA